MSEEAQVTESAETSATTEQVQQPETALTATQDQEQVTEQPKEYSVDIEGFDFEAFKAIESNAELLSRAQEAGLTNEQVSFMLKEYNDILPSLVQDVAELKTEESVTSLKGLWGENFDSNIKYAQQALKAAGFTQEDLDNPAIGNNVELAKLAAHFGAQMKEDVPPSNITTSQVNVSDRLRELMTDPAYRDVNNPNHKSVKNEVESIYAKGGKLND